MRLILPAVLLCFLCGSPASAADPADTHPDLHLIPWPKSLQRNDGWFALTSEARIVFSNESLKPLAAVLADDIAKITGLKLTTSAGPARAGDIVIRLNPTLKAGEPILQFKNREAVRSTDGAHGRY